MSRSAQQNKSLQVYCRQVALALNEAGLDMKEVLKPEIDIPWSDRAVKDFLWRPIQLIMTGEESTTKPDTSDYPKIYEVLNRHLASKLGVSVAWPCIDEQIMQSYENER